MVQASCFTIIKVKSSFGAGIRCFIKVNKKHYNFQPRCTPVLPKDPSDLLNISGISLCHINGELMVCCMDLYRIAETEAKKAGIGMWSLGDKYVSPREWRKNKR